MSRRSPRKKAISPVAIVTSDDEDFVAVASDDPYVALRIFLGVIFLFFFSIVLMGTKLTSFSIVMPMTKANPPKSTLSEKTPSLLPMLGKIVSQLRASNRRMRLMSKLSSASCFEFLLTPASTVQKSLHLLHPLLSKWPMVGNVQ
jgi:hypothetical protein